MWRAVEGLGIREVGKIENRVECVVSVGREIHSPLTQLWAIFWGRARQGGFPSLD